jgi:type III restriction enzyme
MGTPAFMEFVESIQSEGVNFERVPMGGNGREGAQGLAGGGGREGIARTRTSTAGYRGAAPDPPFQPRVQGLDRAGPGAFQQREACRSSHSRRRRPAKSSSRPCWRARWITRCSLTPRRADYRSVVAFFARQLLKDLRLVGGYDLLYPKVKVFIRDHLFDQAGRPRKPRDAAEPVGARGRQGHLRSASARPSTA